MLAHHEPDLRRLRRYRPILMNAQQKIRGRYVIEPAKTAQDFADSFRLVHDVYVAAGYMPANAYRMRIRSGFEANMGMVTFVARDLETGGQIVGTCSILNDGPLGLPSESVFEKEIRYFKENANHCGEITGFAVHPVYCYTGLQFELARCQIGWAFFAGYDSSFSVVTHGLQNLSQEVFLHKKIGEEKSYSTTHYDPVVCLWLNPQDLPMHAAEIDTALGNEAFLVDYILRKNPVREYIKNPGIDCVTAYYSKVLTEALVQYLTNPGNCRC